MALQRIRDYELMMILSPEATDEQAAAVVEGVGSYVTERGGSLQAQETWGVRRLAYPIQRYQEGSYMLSWFALDPQDVLELDRTLEASATVLRHLVTKMDKNASRPKVEVAKKAAEAAAVAEKPAEAAAVAEKPAEAAAVAEKPAEAAAVAEKPEAAAVAEKPEAAAVAEKPAETAEKPDAPEGDEQ